MEGGRCKGLNRNVGTALLIKDVIGTWELLVWGYSEAVRPADSEIVATFPFSLYLTCSMEFTPL